MQTKRAGMSFITPYLYVLPCILLLGVFVYIPLVANFYYSTLSFSAFSPEKTFVGLQNYKEMLADPIIRTALVNNVWYCVISVIFQVGLSLGIAAVLEDKVLRRVSTLNTYGTMAVGGFLKHRHLHFPQCPVRYHLPIFPRTYKRAPQFPEETVNPYQYAAGICTGNIALMAMYFYGYPIVIPLIFYRWQFKRYILPHPEHIFQRRIKLFKEHYHIFL